MESFRILLFHSTESRIVRPYVCDLLMTADADGTSQPTMAGKHNNKRRKVEVLSSDPKHNTVHNKMKIAFVTALVCMMALSVSAFAPSAAFSRGIATQVFSEPEEEEGLDLNLEEMFDM